MAPLGTLGVQSELVLNLKSYRTIRIREGVSVLKLFGILKAFLKHRKCLRAGEMCFTLALAAVWLILH